MTGGWTYFKYALYFKLVSVGDPKIQVKDCKLEKQHKFEEKSFLPGDCKEPETGQVDAEECEVWCWVWADLRLNFDELSQCAISLNKNAVNAQEHVT